MRKAQNPLQTLPSQGQLNRTERKPGSVRALNDQETTSTRLRQPLSRRTTTLCAFNETVIAHLPFLSIHQFGIRKLGFRVQDLGFGFQIQDLGFRIVGLGFRI